MSEWRYSPGPVTLEFHKDVVSRVKLLIGPFGTGKTSAGAVDLILQQTQRIRPLEGVRKAKYAIVRNTFPQLRDTVLTKYQSWFKVNEWGGESFHVTEKRLSLYYRIEEIDHEVTCLFKALDSPQDIDDLLSLDITGAHIDEAREIHEDIFEGVLGRVGRYPEKKDYPEGVSPFTTPPQLVLTTNYPSTKHFLYKKFVENPIDGYRMFRQGQEENKNNLPDGYYENLEKDYKDRPDILRTLVRGDWGITVLGKKVYPEFVRDRHLSKVALKPWDLMVIRGWDNTGLSPACGITQLAPNGQWQVLREFVGDEVGIEDFADQIKAWCNAVFGYGREYRDYGDPSGAAKDSKLESPKALLRKKGLYLIDGATDFKTRRESVASRLQTSTKGGEPGMLLDPSCKTLADGFEGGYAYKEIGSTGIYSTEPQKNTYSHIHDAIQMVASRLFGVEEKQTIFRTKNLGVA